MKSKDLVLLISIALIVVGTAILLDGILGQRSDLLQKAQASGAKISDSEGGTGKGANCPSCMQKNPDFAGTVGQAVLKDGYQEALIEVKGGYKPETLEVKAGVPIKLTFSKGTSVCDSIIVLPFANLTIDVTDGPKTVDIPALKPDTYDYACGMNMLFGKIVAKK